VQVTPSSTTFSALVSHGVPGAPGQERAPDMASWDAVSGACYPLSYLRSLRPIAVSMPDTLPQFLRAMGSIARLSFEVCRLCGYNPVEPCYRGWPEVCSECEIRCRRPLVTALLHQNLGREPTDDMVVTIAELCSTYSTHRRRLHFLHNVLLSRHSCFHRFTFFSGGVMGSISGTEDVVDRIMSFL
jgi:hypothetical protein